MLPPDRRAGLDGLVEAAGEGWLLPRFAPSPWPDFAPQAWAITEPDDLSGVLERLRPTPYGHFTTPVAVGNPAARTLPRTYVRCTRWPHPGFDRFALAAQQTLGSRLRRLDAHRIAYVTSPAELASTLRVLLETAPTPA